MCTAGSTALRTSVVDGFRTATGRGTLEVREEGTLKRQRACVAANEHDRAAFTSVGTTASSYQQPWHVLSCSILPRPPSMAWWEIRYTLVSQSLDYCRFQLVLAPRAEISAMLVSSSACTKLGQCQSDSFNVSTVDWCYGRGAA